MSITKKGYDNVTISQHLEYCMRSQNWLSLYNLYVIDKK